MPIEATSSNSGRNFRIEIDPQGSTESHVQAFKALLDHAKASPLYRMAKEDYELRVIKRDDKTLLELHTRDFISRTGSFLKGILTGTRARRTEERERSREAALRFHAGLLNSDAAHQAGLNTLRQHLRPSKGQDPVATAALDKDKASVDRDVKSAMHKLKAYLLKNPEAMHSLRTAKSRDQKIYAKGHALLKHKGDDVLRSWNSDWSTADTCGFMLDIALSVTSASRHAKQQGEPLARPDLFKDGEGSYSGDLVRKAKEAAKAGVPEHSPWAAEFVPVGSPLQAGASATVLSVLELLSRVEGITPQEIEAVMNGAAKYWAESPIKQLKGQFHTATEVWASYNHFLESRRIPRDLIAVAPQSKALIEALHDERPDKLLQIHANWQHASAQGLGQEAVQLAQAQLEEIEAGLDDRVAISLYLGDAQSKLLSLAPDTPAVNALLSKMRDVINGRRADRLNPISSDVVDLFKQLSREVPARDFLKVVFPFVGKRAEMLPASQDQRLAQIVANLHALIDSDPLAADKLLQMQLRDCHDSLPPRDAALFLAPIRGDLKLILQKVPATGYEAQLAPVLQELSKTTWDATKETRTLKAARQALILALPAKSQLWLGVPSAMRERLDRIPESDAAESEFKKLLKALSNVDKQARAALMEQELTRLEAAFPPPPQPPASQDPVAPGQQQAQQEA